ncbi:MULTISPECIES: citrate synthase [Thermoactinomyces]|jgi:citrate synthase|uniref:Citrate synthase n=1 Tax=Thermoactinomyces vulgaris TaxID=2026 RepID=A0ABS0QGG3_THEVU|nr:MULTISPECIES: citrate synthase [Thermoactinomyces]KFZ39591.1 citrate synthase [Thermoactinomyces sp. Gus2-1]KYQ87417.1 citrate synthase [Thermoactinomyces sp. AS95]MBA4551434.1 citrate synthase [Thermoactinomyces vulgaris]MBA4595356.1 citrate synthase [Thermoactinomyces vulgaris]MBH8585374.1 citrate synthase [Thermoactinomyces sp. CICC 10520]
MTVAKGLEGIVACSSEISSIIDGVLTYRGYNIDDLADNATFEEVAFLLWKGHLPTRSELDELKKNFEDYAEIPDVIYEQLKAYPKDVHPMGVLRTAVSTLALYDEEADDNSLEANQRKAIKLTAKIPTIITAFARIRQGLEPVAPKKGLSFAANFLYMLTGEEPSDVSVKAFDKALVLHADHELNASTFAARVTTGTLSDIYSAVTTAVGTLKGPLHGGANERVMAMLEEIGSPDRIETVIQDKLDRKEKIMGFGHRVYKNGDPRAKHLREMSRQLSAQHGDTKWYDMSTSIEKLVTEKKGLKPNVDFYSASVYTYLGIPRDLFTPIFAMSRVTGWTAHILEQYRDNRLIRPRAEYVGPTNQRYVPVENR